MCLVLLGACNRSSETNHSGQLIDNSKILYDSFPLPHDHDTLGKIFATQQLHELLDGKVQPFTWDTLVKNSSTAIAMVEPLLFDIFGKSQIIAERPYEVYQIDGFWYLSGTIPKGSKGGGFEIIVNAKDGKIIRLTHYK